MRNMPLSMTVVCFGLFMILFLALVFVIEPLLKSCNGSGEGGGENGMSLSGKIHKLAGKFAVGDAL